MYIKQTKICKGLKFSHLQQNQSDPCKSELVQLLRMVWCLAQKKPKWTAEYANSGFFSAYLVPYSRRSFHRRFCRCFRRLLLHRYRRHCCCHRWCSRNKDYAVSYLHEKHSVEARQVIDSLFFLGSGASFGGEEALQVLHFGLGSCPFFLQRQQLDAHEPKVATKRRSLT